MLWKLQKTCLTAWRRCKKAGRQGQCAGNFSADMESGTWGAVPYWPALPVRCSRASMLVVPPRTWMGPRTQTVLGETPDTLAGATAGFPLFAACGRKEDLTVLSKTLPRRGRVVTAGDGERGFPADLPAHWRRTLSQKGIVKGNEPLTRCGVGGVQRKGGGIRNTPHYLWPSGASSAVMFFAKAIKPASLENTLHGKHGTRESAGSSSGFP